MLGRDEPFIESMQTPIVKVFMNKQEHTFYNNLKFLKFAEENKDSKYKVKYYKGLGTSSNKEVKATFGQKVIDYVKDEKKEVSKDVQLRSAKCGIVARKGKVSMFRAWLSNNSRL